MFWRGSETILDSGTVTLRPLRVRRTKLSQAGALVPPEAAMRSSRRSPFKLSSTRPGVLTSPVSVTKAEALRVTVTMTCGSMALSRKAAATAVCTSTGVRPAAATSPT